MATTEVNMDLNTLSLEETAINQFSDLISTHKTQINSRFAQLHDMLHNKQTSLINQLDHLLTDIRTHRQTHDDQLRQLRETKEQVQTNLTHNKLNAVLERTLNDLQDSINKLENETLVIPTVDISWDTSNYSTVVDNICRIDIVKLCNYSNKTHPIWSTVSRGKGQYQLYDPRCLAVDQDSGDIYVTDYDANRIQIYNCTGEYVRTINTVGYYPSCMLIDTEYCYVMLCMLDRIQLHREQQLFKINKLSGNIVNRVDINKITGMCLDSNSIFMCVYYSSIVLVYNKNDLKQTNSIQLNTQYYTPRNSTPRDIKLLPAQLIILFIGTDYPLQCFNREGTLLRTIISKHQINLAYYFCMDKHNNYIISDRDDNNIKIFTPLGKLITSIGKPGQFKYPRGISLDLNNKIIVCDYKHNYMLQAF